MLSTLIEMNRDDEGNVLNEELISGYAASIYVGELRDEPPLSPSNLRIIRLSRGRYCKLSTLNIEMMHKRGRRE